MTQCSAASDGAKKHFSGYFDRLFALRAAGYDHTYAK